MKKNSPHVLQNGRQTGAGDRKGGRGEREGEGEVNRYPTDRELPLTGVTKRELTMCSTEPEADSCRLQERVKV